MGRRALLPRRLALLAAVGLLLGAVGQAQAGLGSGAPARSVLPDGLGIAHALAVQESFNEAVLSLDGVVGTGVGRDASGRATVKLFTESRAIAGLPDVLAGVPVEVEVTGRIRVRVDATGRLARPVFSGVSSGHPAVGAGTVGARVTKNGNLYALSNNHVFANSGFAAIGDSLLQPAVTDGGEEPDDVFATLAEFEPIDFSRGGHNTIDAALGLTTSSELAATTPEDGYGAPGTTTVAAHVGQLVQKYGRTTGLTSGVVEAINVSILACYAEFFTRCVQSASFDNQIAIADISGPFSRNGDSGSLIVTDDASRNPVGLLFAGGAGTTFANPIDAVLDALRVTIDGDGAPAVEPASPERREAMYFVLRPAAALGSASFEDEDIAYYDGGDFGLHFDGSDVGVAELAIDAIAVAGPAEILISFTTDGDVAGVGTVDESDIVLFTATSLGDDTAGTFSMYLDGSDVGLIGNGEDVDAIDLLSDGRIVVSTHSQVTVPGVSGNDEDLLVFSPTTRGVDTSGTWAHYFDGSDAKLASSNEEDIDGVAIVDDAIFVSTRGRFFVPGLNGHDEDVARFDPVTLGADTTGSFASPLEFDGSELGLEETGIAALDIVASERAPVVSAASNFPRATSGSGSPRTLRRRRSVSARA